MLPFCRFGWLRGGISTNQTKGCAMKKVLEAVMALGMLASVANAGVNKIRSNGNISGVPSYQVTCSSGKTVIIYKKDGTWYTGGLGHMGHKYDSWSRDEVAEYICK